MNISAIKQISTSIITTILDICHASSQLSGLSALITKAYYHIVAQKSGTEWILLSQLGLTPRELDSSSEATYGKQNLLALIGPYNGYFEIRKRTVCEGQVEEVCLRQKARQSEK